MNIVYLITNTYKKQNNITPYLYIGSKTNWQGSGTYWGTSKHPDMIHELKENPEHFTFEVIDTIEDAEQLLELELFEQLKVHARDNDVYYNLAYANRSNTGFKWMTKDSKDIQVPKAKQKYFLNEGYEYGRSSMKGRKPWNKGVKATKERSENMSKAIKGRKNPNKGKSNPKAYDRPIMNPFKAVSKTGEEFLIKTVRDSKEITELSGLQYQSIRHHMNQRKNGKNPTARGGWAFYWV